MGRQVSPILGWGPRWLNIFLLATQRLRSVKFCSCKLLFASTRYAASTHGRRHPWGRWRRRSRLRSFGLRAKYIYTLQAALFKRTLFCTCCAMCGPPFGQHPKEVLPEGECGNGGPHIPHSMSVHTLHMTRCSRCTSRHIVAQAREKNLLVVHIRARSVCVGV